MANYPSGDQRGNSKDRAARRRWLLDPKSGFGGNGIWVPCAMRISADCTDIVDDSNMDVDRIVPGCLGGRYVRGNIRPACKSCNNLASHAQKAEKKALVSA